MAFILQFGGALPDLDPALDHFCFFRRSNHCFAASSMIAEDVVSSCKAVNLMLMITSASITIDWAILNTIIVD
jgi:hypothetical protein